MDEQTKIIAKSELQVIKSLLSSASSHGSNLAQTTFPVAGPIVVIPTLGSAAQAIKMQSDATTKLVNVIEKLLDKI